MLGRMRVREEMEGCWGRRVLGRRWRGAGEDEGPCHTVTLQLSHWKLITLSHFSCHTVTLQLSHCHTSAVTLSHFSCHTGNLSHCYTSVVTLETCHTVIIIIIYCNNNTLRFKASLYKYKKTLYPWGGVL